MILVFVPQHTGSLYVPPGLCAAQCGHPSCAACSRCTSHCFIPLPGLHRRRLRTIFCSSGQCCSSRCVRAVSLRRVTCSCRIHDHRRLRLCSPAAFSHSHPGLCRRCSCCFRSVPASAAADRPHAIAAAASAGR